ncbi:transposase|uniref:REP element-mobilizing transposase RayT n=1 Tax=Dendrosporobacter quercicolus TaxID=146817 RepID=A0A1G9QH16_9FIRM|nr:transposase [Dendrosporobacter quercicolus]NSL48238.1 transposase [Dendrosporobacter quercicolus DSM 1736]SDM10180.1 REP element-mobilizing transposase RayT [Dendrosporobacter quercicolus]
MPRKARQKSESGIYHIVMRGINRQNIFEDEEDCMKFMQTIQKYKEKSRYEVYAYCLMGNHVHLLLKIGQEPLEQVMRRICGSYVFWYNTKYQRVGNLFQDRFKSEPVEDDIYLLSVQRYIHQNPVDAGLAKRVGQYQWSSFTEYTTTAKVADTDFILGIFNADRAAAIKRFIQHNQEVKAVVCLDSDNKEKPRMMDEEARRIIREACNIKNPAELQHLEKVIRNTYLRELKETYCLSIRQIERITGINRGVVLRA